MPFHALRSVQSKNIVVFTYSFSAHLQVVEKYYEHMGGYKIVGPAFLGEIDSTAITAGVKLTNKDWDYTYCGLTLKEVHENVQLCKIIIM